MEIKTKIKIAASPAKVWAILTDFEKYPDWNPFIKSLTGKPRPGEAIKVELGGMEFKPTVLVYDKNQELRWLGKLWMKGLFDGEHRFFLTENSDGGTTLVHSEKFAGLLIPLLKKKLLTETKPGFEAMNAALKARAER